MKRNYVVLEGLDAAGKGTQLEKIKHLFGVITKEPGSPASKTCMDIRSLILDGVKKEEFTTGLLFLADANEHLTKVVKPALDSGQSVLSDRSMLSDLAYRPNFSKVMRESVLGNFKYLKPFIIFLDVSPDIAKERMIARGKLNQYEQDEVIHRLSDLRKNYLKALAESTLDFVIVDADKSIEGVTKEIQGIFNQFIL